MSFISEFKEFALKGNVMDLAVGVIIGGAFGKIVDSVVGDLIMPVVGKIFGGLDFNNYYIALAGQAAGLPLVEAKKAGVPLTPTAAPASASAWISAACLGSTRQVSHLDRSSLRLVA